MATSVPRYSPCVRTRRCQTRPLTGAAHVDCLSVTHLEHDAKATAAYSDPVAAVGTCQVCKLNDVEPVHVGSDGLRVGRRFGYCKRGSGCCYNRRGGVVVIARWQGLLWLGSTDGTRTVSQCDYRHGVVAVMDAERRKRCSSFLHSGVR